MPQLLYHGANCCGVTHLYLSDLNTPGSKMSAVKKFSYRDLPRTAQSVGVMSNENLSGYQVTTGYRQEVWYRAKAHSLGRPAETAGERAKALLDDYKKVIRQGGLIEVVTIPSQESWHPWLEAEGFKAVTRVVNSNSHNRLTIWHLAYGKDPDTWESEDDEDDDWVDDYDEDCDCEDCVAARGE